MLNNSNGFPQNVDVLDLLNVFSLWAQVENMEFDAEQAKYIEKVIKAIANEIDSLHKENDTIMKQNELIAEMIMYANKDDIYRKLKGLNKSNDD